MGWNFFYWTPVTSSAVQEISWHDSRIFHWIKKRKKKNPLSEELKIFSPVLFFVYSCNESLSKGYLTKSIYVGADWTWQTGWWGEWCKRLLCKISGSLPQGRKQIVLMYLSHLMAFSEGNCMSCDIYRQERWLHKEKEGLASVRTEWSVSNSTVMTKLCDDVYALLDLDGPGGSLKRVGGMGHGFRPCLCFKSNTSYY